MARKHQPYLPLYIQDFMTDEKLAECSASSTGVYIRIMCLMHKSEEYGKIPLSSKDLSLFGGRDILERFANKLIRHLPYTFDEIRAALGELVEEKVLYIEDNKLCQKRMVRDAWLSTIRAEAGRKGAEQTNKRYIKEEKPATAPKPKKKADLKKEYAEYVFMTEDEYLKLIEVHGEEKTKKMIEILDNYKGSHGTKYKSDYRAILSWVVDKYNKEYQHGTIKTQSNTGEAGKGTPRDYEEEL